MDISKFDLNKPYGDPSFQVAGVSEEKPQEKTKPEVEEVKETPMETSEVEEESVEEDEEVSDEKTHKKPSVTYSRFKNVHERALEAERERDEIKARLEVLEEQRTKYFESPEGELPEWWKKLYGDSDASKEAWGIQSQRDAQLLEQAEERAVKRLEQKQREEALSTQENLKTIDENLEDLSAFVGHDLTEKEQSAVLDIVDEYTPKNEDGNYLGGASIPFEKAWEIYELKNQVEKQPAKKSRDKVASISGSNTQGEPSADAKAEEDKNFNPLWSGLNEAIRKRLSQ